MSKKSIKKLQVIQNNFIRNALNLPGRTNVDAAHCTLKVLHVENRRYLNLMHLMHIRSRNAEIEPVPPQRVHTRQSDKLIFKLVKPMSEKYAKSLAYIGPKLWNELSPEEQLINDADTFKRTLKKRLSESELALYYHEG